MNLHMSDIQAIAKNHGDEIIIMLTISYICDVYN